MQPGSLVLFPSAGSIDASYYFIGPALKKPIIHVLVKGIFVPSGTEGQLPQIRLPLVDLDSVSKNQTICTSQQVFQELLECGGPLPASVLAVKLCQYTLSVHQMQSLCVSLVEVADEPVEVTAAAPKKRKIGKAPFQLKLGRPRKPKRKKPKVEFSGYRFPWESQDPPSTSPGSKIEPPMAPDSSRCDKSEESDCDADTDTDTSSETSSSSFSSCEDEHPHTTEHAEQEEKETEAIEKNHLEEQVNRQAGSAAGSKATSSTAKPEAARGKSFCNAHIGVCDVGVQISGRLARCRQCVQPIEKQCTRVAVAFSRTKFAAWVHCSCLPKYLAEEQLDIGQAIDFLVSWQETPPAKSHKPCVSSDIADLVQNLLHMRPSESNEANSSAASSSGL